MKAPPADAAPLSPAARVLVFLVRGYRLLLSPWLGSACRFEPTCSAYSIEALQAHGAARGSWMAACRLCRCHPFAQGGYDPVPGAEAETAQQDRFAHPATGHRPVTVRLPRP